MPRAIGVTNGNFRGGDYLKFNQSDLTSPRDDVLKALKERMDVMDYSKFFDAVYTRYRWSDEQRYERILRYMLERIKRGESRRNKSTNRIVTSQLRREEL